MRGVEIILELGLDTPLEVLHPCLFNTPHASEDTDTMIGMITHNVEVLVREEPFVSCGLLAKLVE